jgi:DNA-binding transcriptional regulator LsrR (DeoR family)
MANTRKSMRKIRHVLKLAREAGLTQRQIARSLAMSPEKVCDLFRLHALIRKMLARFN